MKPVFSVGSLSLLAGLLLVGILALVGCATKSTTEEPVVGPVVAPPPVFADLMSLAEDVHKAGNHVDALGYFEAAAKADPSKKQPWLRMAQLQFDARNYGPAISAAQEALQRDTADTTAQGILAMSGLRVSAQSLEQLRKANAIESGTRGEAEVLARALRETFGESIFPANPSSSSTSPGSGGGAADSRAVKPATRSGSPVRRPAAPAGSADRSMSTPANPNNGTNPTSATSATAPGSPAGPARAASANSAPAAKRNPFDALK